MLKSQLGEEGGGGKGEGGEGERVSEWGEGERVSEWGEWGELLKGGEKKSTLCGERIHEKKNFYFFFTHIKGSFLQIKHKRNRDFFFLFNPFFLFILHNILFLLFIFILLNYYDFFAIPFVDFFFFFADVTSAGVATQNASCA